MTTARSLQTKGERQRTRERQRMRERERDRTRETERKREREIERGTRKGEREKARGERETLLGRKVHYRPGNTLCMHFPCGRLGLRHRKNKAAIQTGDQQFHW